MDGIDRVVRLPELKAIVGLGTSTVYELMAAGTFPKQVKLSARAVGWRRSELMAWLQSRRAEGATES
jgi:prophage regulatory protein